MAQNKNQRYASADEMRRALKSAQSVTTHADSEARTVLMPPVAAATVARPAEMQAGSNETARLEGVHTRAVTALPSGSLPPAHRVHRPNRRISRKPKQSSPPGFKKLRPETARVLVGGFRCTRGVGRGHSRKRWPLQSNAPKPDTPAAQPVVEKSKVPATDPSPIQSSAQQPQTASSPAAVESTPETPPSAVLRQIQEELRKQPGRITKNP